MGFFKFLKFKNEKKKSVASERDVVSPLGKSKAKIAAPPPSATSARVDKKKDEDFLDITLDEADMDKDLINVEKRKHLRINRGEILDEEIKVYCRDVTTGKSSNGVILDISPGGLLMVCKGECAVGDVLLVSCHIGLNFRMKEQIKIRMVKGRKCGAEFISPSEETTTFLTQLYGAVGLGRPKTRNK